MKMISDSVCDSVIKWSLYITLFFVPLCVLPLTLYPVDLNKQFLFITLALAAGVAWLLKAARKGKFEYAKGFAGVPLAALVFFTALSAFFSGARWVGFMGVNGGEADTVIAVIGFALFYFLVANSFRERDDARAALFTLAIAAMLPIMAAVPAMLAALLAFVGYPIALWDFVNVNSVGTTNAFGLYTGFVFVLSFAVFRYIPLSRRLRIAIGVLAAAAFALSFLIGYFAIFIGIILSLGIFLILDARSGDTKQSRHNGVAFAVLGISLCMLVFGTGIISVSLPRIPAPPEVAPSISASLRIAQATAREGIRSFILGSGPSTYAYQYALHRDGGLNATPFWNIRFTQGFDAVLSHLVSWGLLGAMLFLAFIIGGAYAAFRIARNRRVDPLGKMLTGLFAYVALLPFLYPQNFTLYFLVCVIAGLVTAYAAREKAMQGSIAVWPAGIACAAIVLCGLLYVNGKRYVAGVVFARGIDSAVGTKEIIQALPLLGRGAALDPQNDAYLQALASAYLAQANAIAAKAGATPSADIQKQVADAVSAALAAAERSTQVNPKNVQNWIGLGQMYDAIAPFNENAASSAFAVYAKAQSLDPANPAIATYLGNAHRAVADRMKSGNAGEYAAAVTAYESAIALKQDYAPAYFALIQTFDAEGRGADAEARAERLQALAVNDAATLFQLGVLHYQDSRIAKAQEVLEQAVRVAPDYANALYFLGLVYEKQGNHALALTQFEKVLKLNPDSTGVAGIIDSLRAGKSIFDAGVSAAPVPDKKPASTKK